MNVPPATPKCPAREPMTKEDDVKYSRRSARTATVPAANFTGAVFIDGIRNPDEQTAVGCAHVRFIPGAHAAWHHHPKGQTLYVTDGIGLVATRAGGVQVAVRVNSETTYR